ncbi:hypothetical protein Syun_000464 [Stephania yunnanensis]|uniref:Ubiquitin-like domain-containing protein n=1 Tax=Stephania yunnanensis TaxID=152371 RepID=A0AAP0Q6T4_9MAGN
MDLTFQKPDFDKFTIRFPSHGVGVSEVKLKIQNYFGLPTNFQTLCFNGSILDDSMRVAFYGVTHKSTVMLMYRDVPSKNLRSSVTLYFTYGGHTGRRGDAGDRNVYVHESLMRKIADLKSIVKAKLGIQAYEFIKFMYKEEEMMDNRVLGDYPVTDNTYVKVSK